MKDTTLYDELLGLKQPWYVAGVRLDVVKQEVEVEVRRIQRGHVQNARDECIFMNIQRGDGDILTVASLRP